MKSDRSPYSGYRFPPEIISYAVWAYHRFCVSFRDVEDLPADENGKCADSNPPGTRNGFSRSMMPRRIYFEWAGT